MTEKKYQHPVYFTVRMEKETHDICQRLKVNFSELINRAAMQEIPIKLQDKNLSTVSHKDIANIIQIQERELRATNELIQLLKAADEKRLAYLESENQEKAVQDGIEKEKQARKQQIEDRKAHLQVFYSLCKDAGLFYRAEVDDAANRIYHAVSDEEEKALVHDFKLKAIERLASMDGAGKSILDLLQADERPDELIQTTITWLEQDYRKGRVA